MKLTSALVVTILAFTATAMADPIPAADAVAAPAPVPTIRWGSCGVPGSTCGKKRDAEAIAAREADAEAEPKIKKGTSCGFPGSTCGRKRDAEAIAAREAEAEAEAEPKIKKGTSCGFPGSTCGRKRDAEAIAARGAEAEPKKLVQFKIPKSWKVKGRPHFKGLTSCGFPGSTCARDAVAGDVEVEDE